MKPQRLHTAPGASLFDAKNGEVPGAIRFDWDAAATVVDQAADYPRSLPFVSAAFPH